GGPACRGIPARHHVESWPGMLWNLHQPPVWCGHWINSLRSVANCRCYARTTVRTLLAKRWPVGPIATLSNGASSSPANAAERLRRALQPTLPPGGAQLLRVRNSGRGAPDDQGLAGSLQRTAAQ